MMTLVPRRAARWLTAPRWSIPPQAPVAAAATRLAPPAGQGAYVNAGRHRTRYPRPMLRPFAAGCALGVLAAVTAAVWPAAAVATRDRCAPRADTLVRTSAVI